MIAVITVIVGHLWILGDVLNDEHRSSFSRTLNQQSSREFFMKN